MALNMNVLKAAQKKLDEGTGDGILMYQKEIKEETDWRGLPPLPHMDGVYYQMYVKYWINNKSYYSPETFNESCPIKIEVEEARALRDGDLDRLLDDTKKFKRAVGYLMPGLLLECEFDNAGNATSIKVVNDKAKLLDCSSQLMKAINRIVTGRNAVNGTEDGIFDRVKGSNFILTKTGSGLDTEYGATQWAYATEMDEKYYKNIPDPVAYIEKAMKTDDYLTGVIRNYLYGERMPSEEEGKKRRYSDSGTAANPPAQQNTGRGAAGAAAAGAGAARRGAAGAAQQTGGVRRRAAGAATDQAADSAANQAGAAGTGTGAGRGVRRAAGAGAARRGAADNTAQDDTGAGGEVGNAGAGGGGGGRRSLVDDMDNVD